MMPLPTKGNTSREYQLVYTSNIRVEFETKITIPVVEDSTLYFRVTVINPNIVRVIRPRRIRCGHTPPMGR
jgi:hypothetical protein